VQSVDIDAPVETVFGFHERDDALKLLTPSFPPVKLISKTPGIGVGARVVLRVVVFRWVAAHTVFERNRLFVDEQIEGPMARWVHRHEFEDLGGDRTRLTDRIEFQLPGGVLINRLLAWTTRPGLRRMFAHRHGVTKSTCEAS